MLFKSSRRAEPTCRSAADMLVLGVSGGQPRFPSAAVGHATGQTHFTSNAGTNSVFNLYPRQPTGPGARRHCCRWKRAEVAVYRPGKLVRWTRRHRGCAPWNPNDSVSDLGELLLRPLVSGAAPEALAVQDVRSDPAGLAPASGTEAPCQACCRHGLYARGRHVPRVRRTSLACALACRFGGSIRDLVRVPVADRPG